MPEKIKQAKKQEIEGYQKAYFYFNERAENFYWEMEGKDYPQFIHAEAMYVGYGIAAEGIGKRINEIIKEAEDEQRGNKERK